MSRRRLIWVLAGALFLLLVSSGCTPARQDPTLLVGPEWTLIRYRNALGTMVQPDAAGIAVPSLTLSFVDDHTLAGSGGVNTFGADYRAKKDGTISVGALTHTEIGADPDLMAQEQAYFEALEDAASYEATQGKLTLLDAQGKQLLRFTR